MKTHREVILEAALLVCALKFEEYERLHLAKETPEANVKAAANRVMVDTIDRALEYGEDQSGYRVDSTQEVVIQFAKTYGAPVRDNPQTIIDSEMVLCLGLIFEEFQELLEAAGYYIEFTPPNGRDVGGLALVKKSGHQDIIEIADALGDLDYVIKFMANHHGIHMWPIIREIHRSNMSKLGEDGKPITRADGKILKGPNYSPPDIPRVLNDQIRGHQG